MCKTSKEISKANFHTIFAIEAHGKRGIMFDSNVISRCKINVLPCNVYYLFNPIVSIAYIHIYSDAIRHNW